MVPLALDPTKVRIALVGTGPAAVKRLSHLRDGGADPVVYVPEPDETLEREAGTACVRRLPDDAALAQVDVLYVAGLADDVAGHLAERARAGRVLVNVEDVVALCDFHVPSVVRRGDLLMTVSTGGRSPGLARRLRRFLEERFPPAWAERLDRIAAERTRMRAEGLPPAAVLRATEDLIGRHGWIADGPDLPDFEAGTVWIAGCGPGDPGLLSLLAHKALKEADVVVHDALAGAGILALAGPQAEMIDAGKRGGRPSPGQDEINDRLVALARSGLKVLRLKGGDPFVFGRGGEECLALADAGIPFRVVPAPTAGIGGLAYAGIPVTHRGLATAATFVTGHDRSGDLPTGLDWDALSRTPGTLVFYMALRTADRIAERLIAAGKPPMTPVAIVSSATTDRQDVIETTLSRMARDIVRLQARSPAIIAIGDVVRLRKRISPWQASVAAKTDAVRATGSC